LGILDKINGPNDVRKIPKSQWNLLADEIREFLLMEVSKSGGHLASNLGSVELTLALHLCMKFPEDKLIFDVGHQSYTHKILTGRKDAFHTLRKLDGLSGFPKSVESECDAFDTGHSSTSISAAVGYAEAMRIKQIQDPKAKKSKVCAVIGDGSMTGGMVYEALDQLGHLKSGCVIVLNDNEMSIGKNVGGLAKTLNKLRVGKKYNDIKSSVEKTVGEGTAMKLKKAKDSIRNLIYPAMFFEDMGITYVGPIDGHNIEEMVKTLKDAFRLDKPILIHVKTKKGNGYKFAERYPEYFHCTGPFDLATGKPLEQSKKKTYTDVFAKSLVQLGEENSKVVAITAAMAVGTGIKAFEKKFPERTFDVGIAEQHAVTFAAGLAKEGLIPVVGIYSSFLQRAYDQILHDVCLQKLHVVFAIDRSGLVGADGETHHGIYDTAYLDEMPGLVVLAPMSGRELDMALRFAVNYKDGPVAVKYPKGNAYETRVSLPELELGKAALMHKDEGAKFELNTISIIAVGNMFETAAAVSKRLNKEGGIATRLYNARFIKPLDKDMIEDAARHSRMVVVIEESVKRGSYGESVAYTMIKHRNIASFQHFCLKDEIVSHGTVAELRERQGLSEEQIYEAILEKWNKENVFAL